MEKENLNGRCPGPPGYVFELGPGITTGGDETDGEDGIVESDHACSVEP